MPTVREKDGLAMSSRNAYMTERERADAAVIYRALRKAESLVMAGQRSSRRIIAAMAQMIAGVPSVKVEYISIVDPEEMSELETVSSDAIVSVAARVGRTRLIDNIEVKG
jgi:pantoate--beta-alanine ligase